MHQHLFFDMDNTVAPSRQLILPEMDELLKNLDQDIIIVSGQELAKIVWQTNNLESWKLGQNGSHAQDKDGKEIWNVKLSEEHKAEINFHIAQLIKLLDEPLNYDWAPIEDRGAQITFSIIGNTAPHELKQAIDPDRKKRVKLLEQCPFFSSDLVVKIGGSTGFDYIHKDRTKGTNVLRLIEMMNWNKDECVYFGDGLFPGGNDEDVIGVIETVAVVSHLETYTELQKRYL